MDAHRKEREYKTARKSEIQRAATEKKRTAYINVRAREMLRAALFSPKRENGTEKDNHPANRLRATIFYFDAPQNVVRELFRFGSGSKKVSRHEEKILAPLFPKTRAAIRAIMVRENQIGEADLSEKESSVVSGGGDRLV